MMLHSTILSLMLLAALLTCSPAFTIESSCSTRARGLTTSESRSASGLFSADDPEKEQEESKPSKLSLEEKMKAWEATEDEVKAATLGGVMPGSGKRSDAFDVVLYIAFPLMVLSGLAFAIFPLIMGNLDVDSAGPPPAI